MKTFDWQLRGKLVIEEETIGLNMEIKTQSFLFLMKILKVFSFKVDFKTLSYLYSNLCESI